MANLLKSRLFLDACLEGVAPSDAEIRALLGEEEDLWLDFKSGQLLSQPREAAKKVREYVSAFANSAGGVLIVGIADSPRPRPIDGTQAPGTSSLEEWATRALEPLRSYLLPSPKIFNIATSDGNVLVIATAQSHVMVPIYQNGELTYFLRVGDSTGKMLNVRAPDYLAANLLTGRLARPFLVPQAMSCKVLDGSHDMAELPVLIKITLENDSTTHADDVLIAFVFTGPQNSRSLSPSNAIRRMLVLDGINIDDVVMRSTGTKQIRIAPFEPYSIEIDAVIPKLNGRKLQGALLLNCRSGWPRWHEFTMEEIPQGGITMSLSGSVNAPTLRFA